MISRFIIVGYANHPNMRCDAPSWASQEGFGTKFKRIVVCLIIAGCELECFFSLIKPHWVAVHQLNLFRQTVLQTSNIPSRVAHFSQKWTSELPNSMSFWLKISRGMCTVGANQQVNTSSKRSSRNDILNFFPFYCLLRQGSMPYIICISLCAKRPLNLFLKSLELVEVKKV